jgi:hypothetical protein
MTDQNPKPEPDAQRRVFDRLTARMTRLERAHRRRGWLNVVLMVGLAGSLALSGAIILDPELVRGLTDIGNEVRAHRFMLEDQEGNLRGLWHLDEEGAVRLSIHDADGHARMNLAVLKDGAPGISFADETDRRRVVLGLQGSANLLFADHEGVSRVSVGLDASGAGNFTLPEAVSRSDPEG